MTRCKIVFVGAGSYVFGAAPLRDLLDRHRLPGLELVLVDVNPQMLALMSGVANALVKKHGLDTVIRTSTDAAHALDGADFVMCAVALDQTRRFETDRQIIANHAPGHLISEFGGIHGISMSLRQIAMIERLGHLIRQQCPRATLLNVANPLPRVCQAAHELGVRTVGFCSASLGSYEAIWHLLHGGPRLRFPFEPAIHELRLRIAGLNHYTFVLECTDSVGHDLRPRLAERVLELHRQGQNDGNPRAERFLLEHGTMLAVNDQHTHDFFAPMPGTRSLDHVSHGDASQRAARLQLLRDIGDGRADPALSFEPQAWEYLGDYVAATAYGNELRFHSLNLVNEGQIPQLPRGVFVETAASSSAGVVRPDVVNLPRELTPYCLRTLAVTDTLVQAALTRRRSLVRGAVELDPTIVDKAAGIRAIEACLAAHQDLIGAYTNS